MSMMAEQLNQAQHPVHVKGGGRRVSALEPAEPMPTTELSAGTATQAASCARARLR
jgi:hypothetical protein